MQITSETFLHSLRLLHSSAPYMQGFRLDQIATRISEMSNQNKNEIEHAIMKLFENKTNPFTMGACFTIQAPEGLIFTLNQQYYAQNVNQTASSPTATQILSDLTNDSFNLLNVFDTKYETYLKNLFPNCITESKGVGNALTLTTKILPVNFPPRHEGFVYDTLKQIITMENVYTYLAYLTHSGPNCGYSYYEIMKSLVVNMNLSAEQLAVGVELLVENLNKLIKLNYVYLRGKKFLSESTPLASGYQSEPYFYLFANKNIDKKELQVDNRAYELLKAIREQNEQTKSLSAESFLVVGDQKKQKHNNNLVICEGILVHKMYRLYTLDTKAKNKLILDAFFKLFSENPKSEYPLRELSKILLPDLVYLNFTGTKNAALAISYLYKSFLMCSYVLVEKTFVYDTPAYNCKLNSKKKPDVKDFHQVDVGLIKVFEQMLEMSAALDLIKDRTIDLVRIICWEVGEKKKYDFTKEELKELSKGLNIEAENSKDRFIESFINSFGMLCEREDRYFVQFTHEVYNRLATLSKDLVPYYDYIQNLYLNELRACLSDPDQERSKKTKFTESYLLTTFGMNGNKKRKRLFDQEPLSEESSLTKSLEKSFF